MFFEAVTDGRLPVSLPRQGDPNFTQGINQVLTNNNNNNNNDDDDDKMYRPGMTYAVG